jgi:hypothetical protein
VLLPDPETIRRFWHLHCAGRGVFEVRIPKVRPGGPARLRAATYNGFYDDEHAFVRDVSHITGHDAPGVYVTLNPVDPQLLARRANRLDRCDSGQATADKDVPHLTRLLIDCDPVRDAHVSATEDERLAAKAQMGRVYSFLLEIGWPPANYGACSGNGYHAVFSLDLANEPHHVRWVSYALRGLASAFDTPAVTIDTSGSNPARIVKIPGTIAAKGDHTADRPWRLTRFLAHE